MRAPEGARHAVIPASARAMYDRYHFAPAVRVGDHIWVWGEVGIDAEGRPGSDMAAQARLAFEALRAVLAEAGATLADVVEITTFHTDLRGDMAAFTAVKDEFLPADYPAWTAVGVTQLARPEFLMEIRAVAVSRSAQT